MRLRKNGRVLLCAAATGLAALAGVSHSSQATTRTFTAKVSYATTAVVGKSPEAASPLTLPAPPDPNVFMDSYGFSWADYGGFRQTGMVTIGDSRTQFMNFLTGNLQPDTALEMLSVICLMKASPGESCSRLLAPDGGKNKTIYLGMNVLVKNHAASGDDAALAAETSPSFDITVVYQ